MFWIKIFWLSQLFSILLSKKFTLNIAKHTLKQERWEFLGKFCVNTNQYMKGNVDVQYLKNEIEYYGGQPSQDISQQSNSQVSLNFRIYEDDRYNLQNKNSLICEDHDQNMQQFDKRIDLKDHNQQLQFKFKVSTDIRQCYVMIIASCDQNSDVTSESRIKINANVKTNNDHPNLSFHERDYSTFSPLILVSLLLIAANIKKLARQMKDDFEPFNYMLLFQTITLFIEFFNQLFYYLYFSHLELTGESSALYLVIYLIDSINTQNFIVMTLILLIWGFSILENYIEDGDIFVALSLIFVVFTTMINMIEKLVTLNNYQYDSDFCSIGCWVIQIFNILFLVYFIYQYDEIYIHYENMKKMVYQRFFRLIFVLGIVYLLVFPITRMVVHLVVASYQRQFCERMVMNLTNWVYLLVFQYQLYSNRSDYFKISSVGLSSQLPIDKYI